MLFRSIRSWRGELNLAGRLAEPGEPLPRNVAGLLAVAEADYWIARGDAAAAERVIGAADPAGPYGCVLLARLVELLLDHGRAAEAAAALDRLTEVAGSRFAPWSRVSLLRATGLVRGDPDALRAAVAEARAGELELEWARGVLVVGDADQLVVAYQAFAGMGADAVGRAAHRDRGADRAPGAAGHAQRGDRRCPALHAAHRRGVPVPDLRQAPHLLAAGARPAAGHHGSAELASEHPTTGRCAVSTVDLPGSVDRKSTRLNSSHER